MTPDLIDIFDRLTAECGATKNKDATYDLYITLPAAWKLRKWGIQKAPKKGYFSLYRDYKKYLPVKHSPE